MNAHPVLPFLIAAAVAAGAPILAQEPREKPARSSQARGAASTWDYLRGKYDSNNDGRIAREEYGRDDLHFGRLDADGDGWISPADVEQRSGRGRTGRDRTGRGARPRPGARPDPRGTAPQEGSLAPELALEVLQRPKSTERAGQRPAGKIRDASGEPEKLKLSSLRGERPVALVFGSYT